MRPERLVKPRVLKLDEQGRNKTEARYEREILKPRMFAGEVLDYSFEPMNLRLAKRTYYNPDYMVITPDHLEFHEVKGRWEDDALVKIKVAARTFPWFVFVALQGESHPWSGKGMKGRPKSMYPVFCRTHIPVCCSRGHIDEHVQTRKQ